MRKIAHVLFEGVEPTCESTSHAKSNGKILVRMDLLRLSCARLSGLAQLCRVPLSELRSTCLDDLKGPILLRDGARRELAAEILCMLARPPVGTAPAAGMM